MTRTYDRSEVPDLSEIGGHWDPRQPEYHQTPGGFVSPSRLVARIPGRDWPSSPEECTAGLRDAEWILGGRVLICTGCGLDGT